MGLESNRIIIYYCVFKLKKILFLYIIFNVIILYDLKNIYNFI